MSGFTIAAFVLGGISLLFFPIVFGPIGIVCGAVASSKGDPKGKLGIAAAAAGMVIGMVIGALVFAGGSF